MNFAGRVLTGCGIIVYEGCCRRLNRFFRREVRSDHYWETETLVLFLYNDVPPSIQIDCVRQKLRKKETPL